MQKSRGIRNNNPGNLKLTGINWQGKIPKSKNTDENHLFEQFTTMSYGIRAMLRDIVHDIDKGKNTIRKLISEFAPIDENNTERYIQVVSSSLGFHADSPIKSIDNDYLFRLAKAIIKHENGVSSVYVKDSDIKSAIKNLGKFETKNLNVTIKSFDIAVIIPIILFFYTVFSVTL
jgi:hypothetical protein